MLNKKHNFLEGLEKIVNLRASLNLGLSSDLNKAFANTIPKKKLESYSKCKTVYNNLQPD